jgi:predicted nucleotidyltransferase
VDILIISDQLPKKCKDRGNLKANIEEGAGLPLYHPFEIHLATRGEAGENPIYRHAISEGLKL